MKVTSDVSAKCVGGGGGRRGKEWPPGFRFHPTDEELILYYLKRKICRRRLKLDIIAETDVYKWDPEELPDLSILKTGDRQWFFFSPRDRKYPNGARSSRATRHGYWKATGKDRNITCNSRSVGVKKTLVFYQGRAPNGERTDWVMHEYTLDEEELKRCQNVRDYYALYKVYKKSGPGPKNGEQYGAPFNEEDWAEDDYAEFNNSNQENPLKQPKEVPPDDLTVNGHMLSPLDDTEFMRFMRLISDEPALDQQQVDDRAYAVSQILEEERQSTMVDPSCRDGIFPEPFGALHQGGPQCDVQGSFDFTQSATSQLQLFEAPEVTSAPDLHEHVIQEDFLEIDDLLGPEPTFLKVEEPVKNLQFGDIDGFSEYDLFHDASMFLNDLGPIDQGTVLHSYINSLANNTVTKLDDQLQLHQDVSNGISNQLWTQDQRSIVFTSADSKQWDLPQPTSGVIYDSTDLTTQTNQTQSGKEDGEPRSPFSSALWAFVESIPSSPASAAENALVNRAFERMSSFSRIRINAINTNVTDTGNNSATIRGATRNRGFIFLTVLGVICAILWVMIGSVRISGRCIFS